MRYIIYLTILISISSCQLISYNFSDDELEFVNWIKEGQEYVYVTEYLQRNIIVDTDSGKYLTKEIRNDTMSIIISRIETNKLKNNNWPESGSLFFASKERVYYYKNNKLDRGKEKILMKISKYSNISGIVEFRFEDSFTLLEKKDFVNDMEIFDVSHKTFEGVSKIWWSKSQGLQQFETWDNKKWKRIK